MYYLTSGALKLISLPSEFFKRGWPPRLTVPVFITKSNFLNLIFYLTVLSCICHLYVKYMSWFYFFNFREFKSYVLLFQFRKFSSNTQYLIYLINLKLKDDLKIFINLILTSYNIMSQFRHYLLLRISVIKRGKSL